MPNNGFEFEALYDGSQDFSGATGTLKSVMSFYNWLNIQEKKLLFQFLDPIFETVELFQNKRFVLLVAICVIYQDMFKISTL
jgi:hypothetical protein